MDTSLTPYTPEHSLRKQHMLEKLTHNDMEMSTLLVVSTHVNFVAD